MTVVKLVPPALLESISGMVGMSLDKFMNQAVHNWQHMKFNPLLYASYSMSSYYAERGYVIVHIDPNGPLEERLKKHHRYLRPDDHNFTKRWGVGGDKHMWQYLLHNRPGRTLPGMHVTMWDSHVDVGDDIYLYAVLRDLGCRALPVQVPCDQAKAIVKAFGGAPLKLEAKPAFLGQFSAAIAAALNLVEAGVAIGPAMKMEQGLLFGVPPDDGLELSIEPPTGNRWSYEGVEHESSQLFSLLEVSHPALLVLAHRKAVERCMRSFREGYPKPSIEAVQSYPDLLENYGHLMDKAA